MKQLNSKQLTTKFLENLDSERLPDKGWAFKKTDKINVLVIAIKGIPKQLSKEEVKKGLFGMIKWLAAKCKSEIGLVPNEVFLFPNRSSKSYKRIPLYDKFKELENKTVYRNIIGISEDGSDGSYAGVKDIKDLPVIKTIEEAKQIDTLWKTYLKNKREFEKVQHSTGGTEQIEGAPSLPVFNGKTLRGNYFWIEGLMYQHEEEEFRAKKTGKLYRKSKGIIMGLDNEGGYSVPFRFEKFGLNKVEMGRMQRVPRWRHIKIVGTFKESNYGGYKAFVDPRLMSEPDNDEIFDDNSSDSGRFELSAHTIFSQLEAVCNPHEIWIEGAKKGLNGIALTDSSSVQAYTIAMQFHGEFKHMKPLFGVQMNAIEDRPNFVFNPTDRQLFVDHQIDDDIPIIAFDIETTGLSPLYDDIIQMSAVKLAKMKSTRQVGRGKRKRTEEIFTYEVVDSLDCFVHTDKEISQRITDITGITQEMTDQSDVSQEDAIRKLKSFFDESPNAIIAGQNVVFDYTFINHKCKESGMEDLSEYQIFDTLPLARRIIKRSRGYNLTALSKKLKIKLEQAHNSLYDSEATGRVFIELMMLALNGYQTNDQHPEPNLDGDEKAMFPDWSNGLDIRNSEPNDESYVEIFPNTVNLIAKNQDGVKDLYELISLAHVKHFYNVPKVYYNEILETKKKGNILYGSGDIESLLFDKVMRLGYKEGLEFAKTQNFDYIEIAPIKAIGWDPNFEYDKIRYQNYVDSMIKIANEIGALPVVTGDVHYLTKQQRIVYDILHDIPEDADTKDQSMRSASDLKKEMRQFVKDERLLDDIVVGNTRKVAEQVDIEHIQPVHTKLTPPKIEGADEELTEHSWKRAHELYGEDLPELISKRIEKELKAIINNGYSVVYLTSKRLVDRSLDRGYLVGSRGSVGGSFVAYLTGITEVNSLPPHYRSKHGDYVEFVDPKAWNDGFDLPPKEDPNHPGEYLIADGHGASFEIFAGVSGKKVPDIDLNFASEIQNEAQLWLKDIFGAKHVFRVGTVGTIAKKTAFGYVKRYEEKYEKEWSDVMVDYLSDRLVGVKRTSGQHAAGILVVPQDKDITDFSPYTYPANDKNAAWLTTQFTKEMMHDALLKEDILGHDDPSMLHFLQEMTGIDPKSITQIDILEVVEKMFKSKETVRGLPEFGTNFSSQMVSEAKPKKFSDLVQISGLSHGKNVWAGNAQELIASGRATLQEVIGTRDKILNDMMARGWPLEKAHELIQIIKKHDKQIPMETINEIKQMDLPDWYVDSLQKVTYLFPAAHAIAYVYSAVRIAWFKLHYPREFYAAWMSYRCDDFSMNDILLNDVEKMNLRLEGNDLAGLARDSLIMARDAVANEVAPSEFVPVDLEKSEPVRWIVRDGKTYPGIATIPGISIAVADGILRFRNEHGRAPKTSVELKEFGVKIQRKQIDTLVGRGLLEG